jgi:ERCC4-type nuclease
VEYVMRHVIERKTGRDLANSIMDGRRVGTSRQIPSLACLCGQCLRYVCRYAEQKFRLCNSELDHPIYLVEGSLSAQDAMDSSALARAAVSTQVRGGGLLDWQAAAK